MVIDKHFLKRTRGFFLTAVVSVSLVFPPLAFCQLQNVIDSDKDKNVFLYVGDLVTVKVKSLTKVAVANPGIVDITNASADEMILVGRKVGETQIFIWDESGKKQVLARVVSTDLNLISNRIASLIQSAGISGVLFEKNYDEGKILLSGYLSKNEKKKLDEIIKPFSESLINLVIEEGELIQIDVQFSELDTTLTKALGFDWTTGSGLTFNFQEALPTQDGSFADLFKIGDFSRTSAILSVVNLIIQEGKGRILSKPSLVVTNGEEASFLVGGEIPVRTTSTAVGGGSVQENVTFKDYGVELTVTPELRDGKIDIKVNVTVRDIDASNAVGDDVAFLTRTASTKVRLADTQTIVLAGMIQRRQSDSVKRVPFLSKVPVVGMLFKTKSSPSSEVELVVSLTPRILRDLPAGKVVVNSKSQNSGSEEVKKGNLKESLVESDNSAVSRVELASQNVSEAKTMVSPKDILVNNNQGKLIAKDVKKSELQQSSELIKRDKEVKEKLVADKKVAKKKTKAEAKAAVKLKKQKDQQAKREKQAKVVTNTKIKNLSNQKQKNEKSTKAIADRSTLKDKSSNVKSDKATNINLTSLDDPSLNMALDDPRLLDPKNVLSDEEIASIKEKYSSKIRNQMSETISYPYEAKESQWEGTVVLNLIILPDGSIKDVAVSKSSGYAIFDKDAINTAEILSPYDRFAPAKNLREIAIIVPVEYSEKAILGTDALIKK